MALVVCAFGGQSPIKCCCCTYSRENRSWKIRARRTQKEHTIWNIRFYQSFFPKLKCVFQWEKQDWQKQKDHNFTELFMFFPLKKMAFPFFIKQLTLKLGLLSKDVLFEEKIAGLRWSSGLPVVEVLLERLWKSIVDESI